MACWRDMCPSGVARFCGRCDVTFEWLEWLLAWWPLECPPEWPPPPPPPLPLPLPDWAPDWFDGSSPLPTFSKRAKCSLHFSCLFRLYLVVSYWKMTALKKKSVEESTKIDMFLSLNLPAGRKHRNGSSIFWRAMLCVHCIAICSKILYRSPDACNSVLSYLDCG